MLRAEPREWIEPPAQIAAAGPGAVSDKPEPLQSKRRSGWVATFKEAGFELAPVFDTESTAYEVGRKFLADEPFFERIPVVRYGDPIPRRQDRASHSVERLPK